MFTIQSIYRLNWRLLVASMLVAGVLNVAQATVVTVDFEALSASGTSITGAGLDAYLSGFGITISNVTPSGYPEVHDASGPLPGFPANFLVASSGTNFLSHGDGIAGGGANASTNAPISYTLNFSALLDSVSFTRIQSNAFTSPSGSVVAPWSARALDNLGNTIATVGESWISSYGVIPAVTFTLTGPALVTGPDIAALVIERTVTNCCAGVNAAFIDDLVLVSPTLATPEPTTLALLSLGLFGLGFNRRKIIY